MRASNGQAATWPGWCLVPMAAAVAVASTNPLRIADESIAVIAAANAWRYSKSVYLVEPSLMGRLLARYPIPSRWRIFSASRSGASTSPPGTPSSPVRGCGRTWSTT